MVPDRLVLDLQREIDICGGHSLGNVGMQAGISVAGRFRWIIQDVPVAEGQGGDETQVEMLSHPHVAHDADHESGHGTVFDVQDPGGIGHGEDVGDVGGVPDP